MGGVRHAGVHPYGSCRLRPGLGDFQQWKLHVLECQRLRVQPAVAATASARYDATAKTISGTLSSSARTVTFDGGPIAGSSYHYNAAASLTTLAGSWSTTSLTGETVALTISPAGAFTATSSLGCSFGGTVAPRASGKNVFNVSLTFGAAPCALPGQIATGIAVANTLSSGRTQLLVAVVDSTRTYGTAAFGSR